MPEYYIYLIASLPMLQWGMKPPFSFQRFLQLCAGKISAVHLALLDTLSWDGEHLGQDLRLEALERWRSFEVALRNELVKIRARSLQRDAQRYLRQDGYADAEISRLAMNAHRNPSILEAERMLDEARWQLLDRLSLGHYFDLEFLVIYGLKLLLLERWQKIKSTDSSEMLAETLQSSSS